MNSCNPESRCTLADVREISRIVQEFWGAHLYVKVVPDVTPCMNWKEVFLPPEVTTWSRERLTSTILHEWGHRMISPISPGRGAIWRKVAEKAGASESQSQLVVNAATDAWLDRNYLEDSRWAEVYRKGEAEGIDDLEERLLNDDEHMGSMKPFMRIWAGFYRRLLAIVGEVGDGDSAPEKCGLALSDDEMQCIEAMWEVLYEGTASEAERIRRLTPLLCEWLPKDEQDQRLYPRLHPFSGKENGTSGLTDRLCVEARRAGLGSQELAEIFGQDKLDELRLRTQRLQMYARVMPIVKRFFSQRAKLAFSGYRKWNVGRPLRELDLTATIERSAMVLPDVTTLRRHFEKRGTHHGPGSGGVILIIDDSGSTEGKVLLREKEAAFAVIAAARAFGDPVGCVVFGSNVTASMEPTTQYGAVEELVFGLDSDSGGTEMVGALRAALRLTRGQVEFSLMIMTDAEISDVEAVGCLVRGLPMTAHTVAFCFNTEDEVRGAFGRFVGTRFRVLAVSPEAPFAEAALEEIYG